jgi:arginine decarboxylase
LAEKNVIQKGYLSYRRRIGFALKTPILDFVKEYQSKNMSRFHMPGHKGESFLGCEPMDITEIQGADELYEPRGIIYESEKNAAQLFSAAATFYSTEGSSLCIRTMVGLLVVSDETCSVSKTNRPWILAARNIHRSMMDACVLFDVSLFFLPTHTSLTRCTVKIDLEEVENIFCHASRLPAAVFVTSPDYLGQETDIASLAKLCHQYQVFLFVDHAHGAYQNFLEPSGSVLAAGADMCCESAHKTLPVLTGGAYLHLSEPANQQFGGQVRRMMNLLGSTSPSYLTLASLDACNAYISAGYREKLHQTVKRRNICCRCLEQAGWQILCCEPLKIVFYASATGVDGRKMAQQLREAKMECEYADRDFVVCMMTPETKENDWKRLETWAVSHVPEKKNRQHFQKVSGQTVYVPGMDVTEKLLKVRKAALSPAEVIPVSEAVGRIVSHDVISCPPAIPIAVCGETITKSMAKTFTDYGILNVFVVKLEKTKKSGGKGLKKKG